MQVVDNDRCFICGQNNPIGFKATFNIDPEKRRAEATVRIAEYFQGW